MLCIYGFFFVLKRMGRVAEILKKSPIGMGDFLEYVVYVTEVSVGASSVISP